jgi:hypothetical protein
MGSDDAVGELARFRRMVSSLAVTDLSGTYSGVTWQGEPVKNERHDIR